MKLTLWKRTAAALVVTALGLAGCEQKPATQEAAAATAAPATPADSAATPAVTAAYICPMGCEGSASNKPGKCPVCEMELEPNPAAKPATKL